MNDSEKIKKIFSKNLLLYMNKHNLNQTDISTITGVSQQSVSNWLNAKLLPRMGVIETLSNYFGILKSDLIEEKEDQYEEHLKDKPELLELYQKINNNEQMLLLFDKTKDLTPEDMEQVLKIIDTFNKETM